MQDIRPEILEEVESCILRTSAFLEAQGRRIHKYIKRSRKGRKGLSDLEQFGLPIPEDFRALYHNYDGADAGSAISMWEWSVFLDFEWSRMAELVTGNKIMRLAKQNPLTGRLHAFRTARALCLQLDPGAEQGGEVPLLMTLGTLSRNSYAAFDSTLAMLRSVCAVQEAGILRYEEADTAPGSLRDSNEVYYDVKELWDVIRPFNPRADYWPAMIEGTLVWDEIEVELPRSGVLDLDPEVRRLIVGDPEAYREAAEEEMREAGLSEEAIRRARSVEPD